MTEIKIDADVVKNTDRFKITSEINILKGQVVSICGQVGSGKSTFLSTILGDIKRISGKATQLYGSIAFIPQVAWIYNATFRENILFGLPYDELKYNSVLELCALLPDVRQFDLGDQTYIGDKGINLSGGQKQRISIARAIYSDADIYLFDDPLSAVDAHVSQHLFHSLIMTHLKKKVKTVIIVMNQLIYLPMVDNIIYLKNGLVESVGHFENLKASNSEFANLMKDFGVDTLNKTGATLDESNTVVNPELKVENFAIKTIVEPSKPIANPSVNSEVKASGSVSSAVYLNYYNSAGGVHVAIILIVMFCIHQGARVFSDYCILKFC